MHCCTIRPCRFTVAPRGGEFVETGDNRPWLGVTTQARGSWDSASMPLKVVALAPYSPSRGSLRVGDRLLRVLNAPGPRFGGQRPTGFFDPLELLHPGQVARLLVRRSDTKIVVNVKLGSLEHAIPGVFPFES